MLAAHRAGILRLCLPLENKRDVDDLDAAILVSAVNQSTVKSSIRGEGNPVDDECSSC